LAPWKKLYLADAGVSPDWCLQPVEQLMFYPSALDGEEQTMSSSTNVAPELTSAGIFFFAVC